MTLSIVGKTFMLHYHIVLPKNVKNLTTNGGRVKVFRLLQYLMYLYVDGGIYFHISENILCLMQ